MVVPVGGVKVRMPRGPLGWVVTLWAVLAIAGLLLFGLGQLGGQPETRTASPAKALRSSPARAPRSSPAPVTTVATVLHSVPGYARVGAGRQVPVPSTWWGRPSVLPVIATAPGWVQVRLAQRPNESTAWLPSVDVSLGSTPYRIVINLATTHLMLYKYGRLILSAPAGVGAAGDPTPPGEYFAAFDEQPPGPGYGPFVMVTSAHSDSISDWSGSGDAVIGIHGPLGDDAEIGTTGTRVSHGCIRLHLRAQNQLADVPAGTPIDIVR